jgi:hypothetical protein
MASFSGNLEFIGGECCCLGEAGEVEHLKDVTA